MILLVVLADKVLNSIKKFKTIIVGMQVDMVEPDRLPKALDPKVVQSPSFPFHRDPASQPMFNASAPLYAGLLAALSAFSVFADMAPTFSMISEFPVAVIAGLTSNFSNRFDRRLLSFDSLKATFTWKAGEIFRRDCFFIITQLKHCMFSTMPLARL